MRRFLYGIMLGVIFSCCLEVSGLYAADLRDGVVKVFVTSNRIDFLKPWQSHGSESSTGSGCVISGNRILTNAHVVADNTFIQVRKESSPKKYTAHTQVIAHDADLAILTVDDPDFFEGIEPAEFGDLPLLQDKVIVIGFPLGGDKLSITEGVVSRIEVIPYAQSAKRLLAVQIDAAINPGNSGGPVFQDGKLVGIAMQLHTNSQNIGYMIPMPIVQHFLEDFADGKYDGFPALGVEYRSTENAALREYYQLADDSTGIVVSNVQPFFPAENALMRDDVIFSINDIAIAEDGTFEFRKNERLSLTHLINEQQVGDALDLEVFRDGKRHNLQVRLNNAQPLVPPPNAVDRPSYYIYGGLVFTVLTTDLMRSWGDKWWEKAPFDYMYFLVGKGRLNENRLKEVVVLLDILPDDKNNGYLGFNNEVLEKVNGKAVTSFQEFVSLVENAQGNYVIFEFLNGAKAIISRNNIDDITAQIIARNNILKRSSKDLDLSL